MYLELRFSFGFWDYGGCGNVTAVFFNKTLTKIDLLHSPKVVTFVTELNEIRK